MTRSQSLCLAAWVAGLLLSGVVAGQAVEGVGPGAYCPLPEKGEVPSCLAPAKKTYSDFFTALDAEDADDAALATVEDAVALGAQEDSAYLALSSLSYGYYRLAQRASISETADPEITSRLARWNDLLARAYSASPDDVPYRAAVRQAAEELRDRAPIALPCRDADGEPSDCNSTESVLRGFNAASERVGIRGALERLLKRMLGEGAS